ncbi:suppressor of fused domain protein [Microbacterium sp. LTA6]|uniref:suppressor of fused domain protein n=1 Tax=Microbacterium sp. LTA6 TaxID=3129771 RepID=UPI0032502DD6
MTPASDHDALSLIEHFERTLGPIHSGWSVDPDGAEMPFQLVRFAGGSDAGSVAYATLGLSRQALSSPDPGRFIRQELLILAPDALKPDLVASLLLQVGSMVIGTRRALLRGNVIGPAGPLVPESDLTALYVTVPVYFPDEFATFEGDDGDVVIAWLVPITTGEADFISRHGWDAFEDNLVDQDPDLVDFGRSEMKLYT